MTVERSCGAIVYKMNDEVKYLLLQYNPNYWGFVKGINEEGEMEEETIMRELNEETGIKDGEFVGDFRDKISYFYRRRGKTIYKEVIYRLVQVEETQVKLSYEHIGYAWLNYEDSIRLLRYKNSKKVLKRAHEYLLDLLKKSERTIRADD